MATTLLTVIVCFAILYIAGAWLTHIHSAANQNSSDKQQSLINTVNELLPQTQCAQCGYPGCRPYAEAIVKNGIDINLCPPGGDQTIEALANLLGQPVIPLNTEMGENKPPQVAIIVEKDCIGCTLCIQACPVDAIVGAATFMHTVIEQDCTGCELCLPPCPVDCIELVPGKTGISNWAWPKPAS